MSPRLRFLALISADIGSALGSRISLVAIPWLVLDLHGSAADVGYVAAAEMVPYLLTSMFLTPVADWFGLRRSSVVCDALSAVAVAAIAAFPHTGMAMLLLLVAVAGALRGVGDRTKHVLLKPAALAAGYSMIKVTSLYEGLTRLSTLLGAPLGGLLIVWAGARGSVWVDAASFAVCALLVVVAVAAVEPPAESREPYWTALLGGIRYLRADRVLSTMLATVFFLNFFANAATLVFIPLWAKDVLHSPEALGLALGVFAAGALIGTVLFTLVSERLPQYPAFLVGALISGAPRLFAVGWSSNLAVVLTVSAVSGFAIASVNPILGVAMYERIPDALQTRVIGLCTTVCFLGIPIGAVVGGWSVGAFGLQATLIGSGVLCLAVNLAPFLDRRPVLLAAPDAPVPLVDAVEQL